MRPPAHSKYSRRADREGWRVGWVWGGCVCGCVRAVCVRGKRGSVNLRQEPIVPHALHARVCIALWSVHAARRRVLLPPARCAVRPLPPRELRGGVGCGHHQLRTPLLLRAPLLRALPIYARQLTTWNEQPSCPCRSHCGGGCRGGCGGGCGDGCGGCGGGGGGGGEGVGWGGGGSGRESGVLLGDLSRSPERYLPREQVEAQR